MVKLLAEIINKCQICWNLNNYLIINCRNLEIVETCRNLIHRNLSDYIVKTHQNSSKLFWGVLASNFKWTTQSLITRKPWLLSISLQLSTKKRKLKYFDCRFFPNKLSKKHTIYKLWILKAIKFDFIHKTLNIGINTSMKRCK